MSAPAEAEVSTPPEQLRAIASLALWLGWLLVFLGLGGVAYGLVANSSSACAAWSSFAAFYGACIVAANFKARRQLAH